MREGQLHNSTIFPTLKCHRRDAGFRPQWELEPWLLPLTLLHPPAVSGFCHSCHDAARKPGFQVYLRTKQKPPIRQKTFVDGRLQKNLWGRVLNIWGGREFGVYSRSGIEAVLDLQSIHLMTIWITALGRKKQRWFTSGPRTYDHWSSPMWSFT